MEDGVDEATMPGTTTTDTNKVLESPKPMAFTIDFGATTKVADSQRHKNFVEKFQKRHRRGQSLSKIEDLPTVQEKKKLARKAPEIEIATTEEKSDKAKNVRSVNYKLRDGLSLPLKNINSDKMTQSCTLPCIESPLTPVEDIEVTEVSTPELEALRPPSPLRSLESHPTPDNDRVIEDQWISGAEYDFKSDADAVSDAGTYTLDADAYSEEQKARMSIDREFKIETVSNIAKARDYVQSLGIANNHRPTNVACFMQNNKLSPIVSPTQNFSLGNSVEYTKSFNKIMFPSPKAKTGIGSVDPVQDHGCVISVTSSGAFRTRTADKSHVRKLSLTKSEIHVEAYTDTHVTTEIQRPSHTRNLSASLVLVSAINGNSGGGGGGDGKLSNLPPSIGGISASPSKIPSPIHSTRPRSRNSLNYDLSDSSMETESYLKPTEKLLNTLQQRLSLESDPESESERYLNNDARSLLKKPTHLRHLRHNSLDLDEKHLKISNKLEHFQHKNKTFIDQTNVNVNVLNQYQYGQHKIQNSPNNSPIRRSSSFSTKNQINISNKCNLGKESNLKQSPSSFARNGSIQRSASTAAIRASQSQYGDTESSSEDDVHNNLKKKDLTATRYNRAFSLRRARLDEPIPQPKCPNTPEMRRKFHPERAISVDRKTAKSSDIQSRYMQHINRKSVTPTNATTATLSGMGGSGGKTSPKIGNTATKPAPKAPVFARTDTGRFSMRTSTAPAPTPVKPMTNSQKTIRAHNLGKKASGPRSNSSLTSKEVEFQNWKRRKSYDPMKAAAEGKRKAEMARKQHNPMTQSYHEGADCDSSPSHSSSVHRSQSFHGTAALEQYISSEDDEEDLTLSADEGFTPPTPSPCTMSPHRTGSNLRYAWKDKD